MKNVLIVLLALVIGSCKQNTEPEIKTAPSQTKSVKQIKPEADLNLTGEKVTVTFEDVKFTNIYNAYLDLKGSFVNTDAKKVSENAQKMSLAVGEKYKAEDLVGYLGEIESSSDIEAQRVAFEKLSERFEIYIGKNKITSGTIYKQYCPMAFDGKGAYWLSDSKEVRNPYYGDKMLKCGVVDKEIN